LCIVSVSVRMAVKQNCYSDTSWRVLEDVQWEQPGEWRVECGVWRSVPMSLHRPTLLYLNVWIVGLRQMTASLWDLTVTLLRWRVVSCLQCWQMAGGIWLGVYRANAVWRF
jgi:hypothetical protein